MLINGAAVDSLSLIVHCSMAKSHRRALCLRLKELIPRQMYQVAIQAAIGGKIEIPQEAFLAALKMEG